MKAYVGTKIIRAEVQKRGDVDGYAVVYPDGYVSWSPKATFEQAYRQLSADEIELIAAAS